MQLFERFFKRFLSRKAINMKPDHVRKEIHTLLEVTTQRAQKYGGDPFHDYRRLKSLPEKFEYGMNCFLDRMAEAVGLEIVQKVYEDLRTTPDSYIIRKIPISYDLVGIPVLFGIRGLSTALKVYNNAIDRISREIKRDVANRLSAGKPKFLVRSENETVGDYARRLVAIDLALKDRILELYGQGRYLESERLKQGYLPVIEEAIEAIESIKSIDEKELTDEETTRLFVTVETIKKNTTR